MESWDARAIIPNKGATGAAVRLVERNTGKRDGLTTTAGDRLEDLKRDVRELKRANEILRKASAHFAATELDHRPR